MRQCVHDRASCFDRWCLVGSIVLSLAIGSSSSAATTKRVSVRSNGAQAAVGGSSYASISASGRFVAFASDATNLVTGDTNGLADIFVHDRKLGTTTRVSVDSAGMQSIGGDCYTPSISASGRFVAFEAGATNLVPGDTNDDADILVHDRKKGTTTRVSVDSTGAQVDGSSSEASISANGRFVAFVSSATNLVAGDNNADRDIFVHDRKKGTTTRVSVDSTGSQTIGGESFTPSISKSGRFVAFDSDATNLVLGDTNVLRDVFVHDRKQGVTTRVSISSTGAQASAGLSLNPSISANGRLVAFESAATNLQPGDSNGKRDIFVHDRKSGVTTRVSVDSVGAQATGFDCREASISANGRFVAFGSSAANLVAGDTNGSSDIFVHDRKTGKTSRASVSSAGAEVTGGGSIIPSISAKGRFVAFESDATDLVPGDTNDLYDIFLRDRK